MFFFSKIITTLCNTHRLLLLSQFFFLVMIYHFIFLHLQSLHNEFAPFASLLLNYSFMSSTILDSRIKTYSHVTTPIFHCTQTLNCKNPWSITKVMMASNDGLQQWRFVATLEMAHRARCRDVAVEMVSHKANKKMRWEMTWVTKFFQ